VDDKLLEEEIDKALDSYKGERGDLIPILQQMQVRFGYLLRVAMVEVAKFLHIPESSVYSVATFYNQFRLNPPGKHAIKVCLGTACHVKGGERILESWERELGIKVGETTSDGEFSLERVACVGCCALAPVSVVDQAVQSKVTPTRVKGILLSFQIEKEKQSKE
jgi:NADH-quinone oxidoreductase subunit E